MASSPDNTHQRGAVKDPEHDGRLKENREGNSHSTQASQTSKASSGSGASHDSSHTRGAVKDPEHDGRLKENRDQGSSHSGQGSHTSGSHSPGSHSSGSHSSSASQASGGHTQGAVKDPEHDGRMKENRDKGTHKNN